MDRRFGDSVAWVALGVAVPAATALALVAAGVGQHVAALAIFAAGLALVGLTVALNALLRVDGLGGEGLSAAAGVLGATLVLLSGALAALGVPLSPAVAAGADRGGLVPIETVAWLLVAIWLARTGWSLRLLTAPSAVLAWGSVAAAAAMLAAAVHAQLSHAADDPLTPGRLLPFCALTLWCAGLAAVRLLGHPVRVEPGQE